MSNELVSKRKSKREIEDRITGLFGDSIRVKEQFVSQYASLIREVSELIVSCFRNGNKLLLMGNGGSSSDASHIAGEFVNRFLKDRPPVPAIALNTDMAGIPR